MISLLLLWTSHDIRPTAQNPEAAPVSSKPRFRGVPEQVCACGCDIHDLQPLCTKMGSTSKLPQPTRRSSYLTAWQPESTDLRARESVATFSVFKSTGKQISIDCKSVEWLNWVIGGASLGIDFCKPYTGCEVANKHESPKDGAQPMQILLKKYSHLGPQNHLPNTSSCTKQLQSIFGTNSGEQRPSCRLLAHDDLICERHEFKLACNAQQNHFSSHWTMPYFVSVHIRFSIA